MKKLEEYIELLNEELNATAMLAWVHGWRSTEEIFERGERLHKEIEKLINEK